MAAGKADMAIYQGDDYAAMVTVRQPDTAPADITGYAAVAQIRRSVADQDPVVVATFSVSVSSPYVFLSLTHTQTAALTDRYVWDLQLTSPSGIVTTILAGRVSVTAEVTRLAGAAVR